MTFKRWLVGFAALAVGAFVASELVARFVLDLGTPPLYVRDSKIVYLPKPNGNYSRFWNAVSYNSFGMRSRDPNPSKGKCELRVLVLGDSVVNGGVQVDQRDIATTLLEPALAADTKRTVWVGNGSAGGWAPENIKAYIDKFGWHAADAVVFVFNTHDVTQRAEFRSDLGPNFPTQAPILALSEAIERYLPRYLPRLSRSEPATEETLSANGGLAIDEKASAIMRDLLQEAVRASGFVAVIHNRERDEKPPTPNHNKLAPLAIEMQRITASAGARYFDFGPVEHAQDTPSAYRDGIHLSAYGQKLLAEAMQTQVIPHLRDVASKQSPECGRGP